MLREDFGPGDSTELWTHFNEITAGVNEIGQTARFMVRQGIGANPKTTGVPFGSQPNIAPELNLAGGMLARATTMTTPPARAANGRRLTFVDGGPHRVVWRTAWATTSRGGNIWAGILLGQSDAGQDLFGAIDGTIIAESWAPAATVALPGTHGADASAAVAEAAVDFDFDPGDSVMLATRNETNGSLDLRLFEIWTYATITRIGH